MTILGVIPARYASTRFPGKPLISIGGKTMIQRVYEQAKKCVHLTDVIVATDDTRIFENVISFGGKVILTSTHHQSGSDRCAESIEKLGTDYSAVVNIQGDEPFIDPQQISIIANLLAATDTEIATLVKKIDDHKELFNTNKVKAVLDKNDFAIYFSRAPIPFQQGVENEKWLKQHTYYKHIGLYGYKIETLQAIAKLSVSPLEKAESLEQLRWIENGFKIKVGHTEIETEAIDTEADYQQVLDRLKNKSSRS